MRLPEWLDVNHPWYPLVLAIAFSVGLVGTLLCF
jgi:hypothetical protein